MNDHDMQSLIKAAAERQLAVVELQEMYATSKGISTEQLVLDMGKLQATERVILDAIITLFVNLGHGAVGDDKSISGDEIAAPQAPINN
jgi:hypothetical protein